MGIRLPSVVTSAKHLLSRNHPNVPKGHVAVYMGEMEKKRYVVPISYLNHPPFQVLLHRAAEVFGSDHPTGGLTLHVKNMSSSTSHLPSKFNGTKEHRAALHKF